MSTRERWIVYPLIFLTLGITMRDKLLYRIKTNEIHAQRVVCEQLLTDQLSANKVARALQMDCQTLIVHGPNGIPVVVAGPDSSQNGLVQTFSSRGVPQVRLQTNEGSGAVTTIDRSGKTVTLGCLAKTPGVFVYLPKEKTFVPLTLKIEATPEENTPQPNGAKEVKKDAPPSQPAKTPANEPKPVKPQPSI